MAVTTKQLLQIIDSPSGVGGLIYLMKQQNVRGHAGSVSSLTSAQRELLDHIGNQPRATPRPTYQHPVAVSGYTPKLRDATGQDITRGPLTAAEVLWLQRLPTDPAQVSFADAQQLIKLSRDATDKSDQLLLKSMVAPVMDYHDAKAAEVDLANARRTSPATPAAALPALADVIASENPDLRPDEALGRASQMLSEHLAARTQAQQLAEYNAHQHITDLKTKTAERSVVHRGVEGENWLPDTTTAPVAG